MKRLALILVLVTFYVSCSSVVADQELIARDLSAAEFSQLMKEKEVQVIDVRTSEELKQGYIRGAINIDFYDASFDSRLDQLDKSKAVFVYCAAGGRSGKTMKKLNSMGFIEVYNLSGGFGAWTAEGYEVVK